MPKFGKNMSKIGRLPIKIVEGTTVEIKDGKVLVTGPKGSIETKLPLTVEAKIEGDSLYFSSKKEDKDASSIFGTTRANIANAVSGVSTGWSKKLELVGTGFRAEVNGKTLTLTVGYSHPVKMDAPDEISFKVEKNIITVEGTNKETVGQVSAKIRAVRPPEPYKGKGIKYIDEIIRRKAGKVAKAAGAA